MRLFIFILLSLSCFDAIALEIKWEVNNPFRLINYDDSNSDFKIKKGQTSLDFITQRMSFEKRSLLPPIHDTHWSNNVNSDRRLSKSYVFPIKQNVSAWLNQDLQGNCIWRYQNFTKNIDCSEKFNFEASTQFDTGNTELKVKIISNGNELSEKVKVRDRLILGLGDSYASGEGNPDIPATISKSGLNKIISNKNNNVPNGRWMNNEKTWLKKEAQWFDRQCHRSLFSQHVLASLRLASYNSKESVTLMPLACSGAEILDGLLLPQKTPPGGEKIVHESQINFAIKHLCREGNLDKVKKTYYRGYTGQNTKQREDGNAYRCKGELRKPDAILLSVGGNDVGFAPSIIWAVMPSDYRNPLGYVAVNITHKSTKLVCPKYTGQKVCTANKPVGKDRIKYWLPEYYKALADELNNSGLVRDPKNIYFTAYPNPTFVEDGKTLCGIDRSEDLSEQVKSKLPGVFNPNKWQIRITQSEIHDLNIGLIKPLHKEMKNSSKRFGWTFVDSHTAEIEKHGICAGYARSDKNIPLFPHVHNSKWYPESPDQIWAYDVSRLRWFRNTNDSILFQSDYTDSDMNGAFHPDFRAHALIADHLFKKIIYNLNK